MPKVHVEKKWETPWSTVKWKIDDREISSIQASRATNPFMLIAAHSSKSCGMRWWIKGLVPLYRGHANISFDIPGKYNLVFQGLFDAYNRVPDTMQIVFDDRIKLKFPLRYICHQYQEIEIGQEYFGKSVFQQWATRHPKVSNLPRQLLEWIEVQI